jgi:hypothetical protein
MIDHFLRSSLLMWLIFTFGALAHFGTIAWHFPVRYRGSRLEQPWTFRERLLEISLHWWVPGFMAATFFAMAVIVAGLYGVAINTPDYWWKFILSWWGLAVFMGINAILTHIEGRLSELRRESSSFREAVINHLSTREPGLFLAYRPEAKSPSMQVGQHSEAPASQPLARPPSR